MIPASLQRELEALIFRDPNSEGALAKIEAIAAARPEHAVAIRTWLAALNGPVDDRAGDAPRRIGAYILERILGRGGSSVVYLAQQEHPVQRPVALKLLERGFDSHTILARFAREQEALARMNHDCVARIYDAGQTASGQSWFAMELVEGSPITEHCDRHGLSIRDRVRLFAQVCLAVQHAHEKGVVHRDLKPGNVLVATVGGRHTPKLIDFGIAHAMEAESGAARSHEAGLLLGTPAYMAPEQAMGDIERIDTRTDVYALGVVLRELLTGHLLMTGLAHDTGGAAVAGLQERRRNVASGAQPPSDELTWIVGRAMASDPDGRYASAAEFAADLQRFLRHEAVLAAPATIGYRLRKFLQRHRVLAAGVLAVSVTALVGGTLAFVQARTALSERLAAQQNAYRHGMAAAQACLVHGDVAGAQRHLENQPVHLRRWEWGHLRSLADQSLLVLKHGAAVRSAEFDGADRRVLTASRDRTAHIWDATTGVEMATPSGYLDEVCSATWDPTSQRIVTSSFDGNVQVRDVASWRIDRLLGEQGGTHDLGRTKDHLHASFSPDGRWVASISLEHEAWMWDSHTWTPRRLIAEFKDKVQNVQFNAASSQILTISWDNGLRPHDDRMRLHDCATGQLLASFDRPRGDIRAAAIDRQGRRVATGAHDGTVRIWHALEGTELASLMGHMGLVLSVAYDAEGQLLVTTGVDGTGRIWDPDSKTCLHVLRGHVGRVVAAAFAPADGPVATAGEDKTVRLWNKQNGREIVRYVGHGMAVRHLAFSNDGKHLVTASDDRTARVWAVEHEEGAGEIPINWTNSALASAAGGSRLVCARGGKMAIHDGMDCRMVRQLPGYSGTAAVLAMDDAGERAAAIDSAGTLRVWRAGDGTLEFEGPTPAGEQVLSMQFLSTSSHLLLQGRGHLWLVDRQDGRVLRVFDGEGLHQTLRIRADGRVLVTTTEDHVVHVHDVASGREMAALRGHTEAVSSATFGSTDLLLATTSDDGTTMVWNLETGQLMHTLSVEPRVGVSSAAFSPDRRYLVTNSGMESAHIWCLEDGRIVTELLGHEGIIDHVQFDATGDRVLTSSRDGTARLWDVPGGHELIQLRADAGPMFDARFLGDGSRILTISDRAVRIWYGMPQ